MAQYCAPFFACVKHPYCVTFSPSFLPLYAVRHLAVLYGLHVVARRGPLAADYGDRIRPARQGFINKRFVTSCLRNKRGKVSGMGNRCNLRVFLPPPAPADDVLQYSVCHPARRRIPTSSLIICTRVPTRTCSNKALCPGHSCAYNLSSPCSPTLSGALVPWMRYSPLPTPKRSAKRPCPGYLARRVRRAAI